jgi:hypothetical protein
LSVPYGFIDPLEGFDSLDSAPPLSLRDSVSGFDQPLKTFNLTSLPQDHALVLPVGVITQGAWFCDCLQYLPPHWPDAEWMQRIAGHRLVRDSDGLRLEPEDLPAPLALSGAWCVLNDFVGYRNIAHFFSDELAQLAAIRRLRQHDPTLKVLARYATHPNINLLRELLVPQALVDARPAVAMGEAPLLQLERLHLQPIGFNGAAGFYPTFHTQEWWLALSDYREGLACLRQALDALFPANPGVRGSWICFSRDLHRPTEAPQGRQYTNYPELLEALSNRGVIVLDPGLFSIFDLYPLIRSARGFIGIHGAGLANTFLASGGSRVVEIRTCFGVSRVLELLGKAADLDWRTIDTPPAPDGGDRSVIPIDKVLDLLADLP